MTKLSQKDVRTKSGIDIHENANLRGVNLHSSIEMITPEKADNWLKRNLQINRNLNKHHVKYLADQIEAGKWQLNGQSIKFDMSNNLIDGQHRLHAIIKAGLPVNSMVVRNVPQEFFYTLDIGKMRSNSDVLSTSGVQYASMTAAAIGHIKNIKKAYEGRVRLPSHEVLDFVNNNPKIVESSAYVSKVRHQGKYRHFPASAGTACHFLMSQNNFKKADDFIYKLYTGDGISIDSPIWKARNQMQGSANRNVPIKVKVAFVIKAWNYYLQDKPMKRLVFNSARENFPKIV